jgi:hypothetical protein
MRWIGMALSGFAIGLAAYMMLYLELATWEAAVTTGLGIFVALMPGLTYLFDDVWNHRDSSRWT